MYLSSINHNFKIIGLTETWLNNMSPINMYHLDGYQFHCNNRVNKRGGGTGIYVNNSVQYSIRNDLTVTNEYFESIFLELNDSPMSKKTIVGVIYRPPGHDVETFLFNFRVFLNKIKLNSCNCFIMGDFNLDLIQIGSNTKVDSFMDMLLSFYMQPIIDSPTRITETTATLLDNIFTNANTLDNSGILLSDISDHLPVFAIFPFYNDVKKRSSFTFLRRDINEVNLNLFVIELRNIQWERHVGHGNVDSKYNNFLRIFKVKYEKCFPLKTVCIKNSNKTPWMTKELQKLCRKKSTLYKKYLKNKTVYEDKFKKFRNYVTLKIRQVKRKHYKSKFDKVKNNIKSTWKVIDSLINKNKNKNCNIETLDIEGRIIENKEEIVNVFNDFFVNIGLNLQDSNEEVDTNFFKQYLKCQNNNSIFLNPVTKNEIIKIVENMKNDTSPGIDNIDIKVVKYVITLISEPISFIFNECLLDGSFPMNMKIARVTPIYKKGSKNDVNNYRPISVLRIFSKILEKCIYNRLIYFINRYNILLKNQYGFRQGHSTSTAILNLINNINKAIDNKEYAITVFIDLTKAFDVIDHSILLYKLNHYGIRGKPLQLLLSYLTDRKQLTSINGVQSQLKTIKCGVPQGSILGPLLFLIYINDLPHSTQDSSYILFADDTSVFCKGNDLQTLFNLVNLQLEKISNWMKVNKLILNVDKTNYIIFGTRNITNFNCDLYYRNDKINRVSSTKFLGVHLDEKLSWN